MLEVCMGLGTRQCGVLCRSGNCGHGCGYFLLPCSPPSSFPPRPAQAICSQSGCQCEACAEEGQD